MFCRGLAIRLLTLAAMLLATATLPLRAQDVELPLGERLLSLFESGANISHTPHPAVARIIVPEGDGFAFGSGTLVDSNDHMGLVITNWHVVSGGRGQIQVRFPDGFESPAQVLKTDRDWDLAALAIERPKVAPVRLSSRAPQPGEQLTIAGYGPGKYRAMTGPCTQYVSPGAAFPFEMVELKARARQGDSGGPIFNTQGELAGVLFGEGGGTTSGSYCGRVHQFLTGLRAPAPFTPSTHAVALTGARTTADPVAWTASTLPAATATPAIVNVERSTPSAHSDAAAVVPASAWQTAAIKNAPSRAEPAATEIRRAGIAANPVLPTNVRSRLDDDLLAWQQLQDMLGQTQSERIKSILAGIGVLLLALHTHRWINGGSAA